MVKQMEDVSKPCVEQSEAYLKAFDHLNVYLFNGILSRPMLVLTRSAAVKKGYFAPEAWVNEDEDLVHEISINSNWLATQDIVEAMAVLAHEMLHHWQWEHGKPGRGGYHNQEWMDKALSIGLQPVGSGDKVGTDLMPAGPTDEAIRSLPEDAIFPWITAGIIDDDDGKGKDGRQRQRSPRSGKRAKYTCAQCGLNAWAKPGAPLYCGSCDRPLVEQV
jgi:hypothetical protein